MKNLLLVLLIASMTFAGCKKDECEEWEETIGDSDVCVEMREKYYGIFTGTMNFSVSGNYPGADVLTSGGSSDPLKINNAQGYYFKITGSRTFDIPVQTVTDAGYTYTIEGSGTLSANNNTLQYNGTILDDAGTETFTFIGTR